VGMWTRNPVRVKRFSGAPAACVPPSMRMSTQPKTFWPPGCWRCQPVETTRSLRATGNPRSRNQQETARNYCSNPHQGWNPADMSTRRTSTSSCRPGGFPAAARSASTSRGIRRRQSCSATPGAAAIPRTPPAPPTARRPLRTAGSGGGRCPGRARGPPAGPAAGRRPGTRRRWCPRRNRPHP
jgi:hypothetical protein